MSFGRLGHISISVRIFLGTRAASKPPSVQREKGLYGILAEGRAYDLVQSLLGNTKAKRWLAAHFWRCSSGEKIVDMGCGTGEDLKYLPRGIEYVGFDVSEAYVSEARKKHGDTATFLVGTAEDFLTNDNHFLAEADAVLCTGLLHHLCDQEAIHLLRLARKIMSPSGRFLCFEPTFLRNQSRLSKRITSMDRGENVRTEDEWKTLFSPLFPNFTSNVVSGLVRIPYHHILIECRSPESIA